MQEEDFGTSWTPEIWQMLGESSPDPNRREGCSAEDVLIPYGAYRLEAYGTFCGTPRTPRTVRVDEAIQCCAFFRARPSVSGSEANGPCKKAMGCFLHFLKFTRFRVVLAFKTG
jgi:hypothetical protein